MGDSAWVWVKWEWNDDVLDYYNFRRRANPGGTTSHDLVWARSELGPSILPAVSRDSSRSQYLEDGGQGHATSGVRSRSPNSAATLARSTAPYPGPLGHRLPAQPSHEQNHRPFPIPSGGTYPILASRDQSIESTRAPSISTPTTSTDARGPHPETSTGLFNVLRDPQVEFPAQSGEDLVRPNTETYNSASDSGFETIRNPRGYFKKGKVFKVIWPEPRGDSMTPVDPLVLATPDNAHTPHDPFGSTVQPSAANPLDATPIVTSLHTKPRMFVVVRPKAQHCLCLPIYTYSHQGTSKIGLKPEDHAPITQEGADVVFHPEEQEARLRKELYIIVEDSSVQWSPLSRINFTKVQTVEYNLKVRKVGRISPASLPDLEALFREGIGLNEE